MRNDEKSKLGCLVNDAFVANVVEENALVIGVNLQSCKAVLLYDPELVGIIVGHGMNTGQRYNSLCGMFEKLFVDLVGKTKDAVKLMQVCNSWQYNADVNSSLFHGFFQAAVGSVHAGFTLDGTGKLWNCLFGNFVGKDVSMEINVHLFHPFIMYLQSFL